MVCRRSINCISCGDFRRCSLASGCGISGSINFAFAVYQTNCNEVHEQKCTENQCGQSERGKAVVIQTIDNLKGTGQVVIRGMEWSAKAREDKIIKEGTVVKVITVEGVKAVVEEEK